MNLDGSRSGDIFRGALPVGGNNSKKQAKPFVIQAKDLTQAYQSDPVPLCYGAHQRAAAFIFPVFNFRTKKVKEAIPSK